MQAAPSIARISETLCREHWAALVAFAVMKGNTRDDATDAVQEMFLIMLQRGDYETLGRFEPPQQRTFLQRKLGWHLINRHRARLSRRMHLQVDLEAARNVATDDTPELALDRGILREALTAAGVTEDTIFPERGALNGCQRTRLTRHKRRLRGRFHHFKS